MQKNKTDLILSLEIVDLCFPILKKLHGLNTAKGCGYKQTVLALVQYVQSLNVWTVGINMYNQRNHTQRFLSIIGCSILPLGMSLALLAV